MKIALDWLREFVEWPDVEALVDGLTRAGIEVEAVDDPAARIQGVVVALVEAVADHPKADKLRVCTVNDGTDSHQVVCGAANVAEGQRVAFARVGAVLGDFKIGSRKLRGVQSAGMICAREELGLAADSDGIWVLPDELALGDPIFEAFPAPVVLELGITPNRPDLLSHLGVAREVAAVFGTKLTYSARRPAEKGPPVDGQARVLIEDPSGCRRYLARVIQGVTVGPSPRWLRDRLERIGQRSINNVVDATNYVLFELGHPLHAFDLSRLRQQSGVPTVRVRRAEEGESLTTLDGEKRDLAVEDLVIADADIPVALAGVMGGQDSEVSKATTTVLLESAWFEPARVRSTAKRFGLHSEASHRFERGADPGAVNRAVDRCAQLIVEVAGGESSKGVVDVSVKTEVKSDIRLRLDRIERLLGVALKSETVVKLLEPLEIRCTARHADDLHFEAPSFRPDLRHEIDLIEEVARRYGYDEIPDTLPNTGGPFRIEASLSRPDERVRASLLASGVSEAVTFGFGSPSRLVPLLGVEGEPLRILNPLGEELSAMRTSLLPGLLEMLARNIRHGSKSTRLFELGATFHPAHRVDDTRSERDRLLPDEQRRVGVILWGERYPGRWFAPQQRMDFSDLAGVLDDLGDALGVALHRVPAERDGTNPVASAELRLADRAVGWAAQLHPELLADYDIDGLVFAAELELDTLPAEPKSAPRARSLPKFPSTRRDIAVVASCELPSAELARHLQTHAGGELGERVVEAVHLFDVYSGKGIPADKVSLAFSIEYRHHERTLTDDEVNRAFHGVIASLRDRFGVEIR